MYVHVAVGVGVLICARVCVSVPTAVHTERRVWLCAKARLDAGTFTHAYIQPRCAPRTKPTANTRAARSGCHHHDSVCHADRERKDSVLEGRHLRGSELPLPYTHTHTHTHTHTMHVLYLVLLCAAPSEYVSTVYTHAHTPACKQRDMWPQAHMRKVG